MVADAAKVSDHTKDLIWQDMLDVSRYMVYYEALTNQWALRHKVLRAGVFIGATLSIASIFEILPPPAGLAAALTLIVATVVDFVWDWGVKASLAHAVNIECHMVDKEYAALWAEIKTDNIGDREAQQRTKELMMRVMAVTTQLSETNRKVAETAEDAGYKNLLNRWVKVKHDDQG